jgi:uncharacterized membrane protein (DUF485 family)
MNEAEERELQRLVARRWRVAGVLTALMIAGYFGFILLIALAKDTAGTLLANGGISIGILVGAGAIVLAPVLTSIYVRWANRHYDPAVAALRKRGGPSS